MKLNKVGILKNETEIFLPTSPPGNLIKGLHRR